MADKILVVEDEAQITRTLRLYLEQAGYQVVIISDGAQAMPAFRHEKPDLVILDLHLPHVDGWEVCRQIRRETDTPIIMLTARSEESDKLIGLELGADDYVTKPFSPRELVARVGAILKRAKTIAAAPAEQDGVLQRGPLTLDAPRFQAEFSGQAVPLTALEFAIMRMLAARPGIVFSRDRIMDVAYADNVHVSDRTIDSHVRNIRAKFASVGCPSVIDTVHGVGFRLGDLGAKA